ncbi:MAG: penicillin-binding protein 2 [Fretibacterium sp.]|nr:penicillin-binding protein 2 [Fretibacterium sp.]
MRRNYRFSPWLIFLGLFLFLAIKLVERQCFPDPRVLQQSQQQYWRRVPVRSSRGIIQDCKEHALVIPEVSSSFAINPQFVTPSDIEVLQTVFPEDIVNRIRAPGKNQFVWLKRQTSQEEAEKIEALGLESIYKVEEQIRSYPNKNLMAHVLGFCNIDNYGQTGIEQFWNSILFDPPGYRILIRQPGATSLSLMKEEIERKHVTPVVTLTVDSRIQYVLEKHLENISLENKAKWGAAVCMNPRTGEVLAMSSWPFFDPSDRRARPAAAVVNNAVSRNYEPGSTFKPILMGIALEEGLVRKNELFVCPARLKVADGYVAEAYPKAMGNIDTANVLIKSSNVGMAQIGIRAEKVRMYETLRAWGFGRRSDIELPGVGRGLMASPGQWRGVVPANIAIGQGLAMTPLQLATAMAAVVNGGKLMSPYIVKKAVNSVGEVVYEGAPRLLREVLTPETSQWLRTTMRRVVTEGTGKNANTSVTSLGGKTGTAQVAEAGKYSKSRYVASFIGFWPFESPRYLMLIVVGEPSKGRYYGGELVAPTFRRIVEEMAELEYLTPEKKGTL